VANIKELSQLLGISQNLTAYYFGQVEIANLGLARAMPIRTDIRNFKISLSGVRSYPEDRLGQDLSRILKIEFWFKKLDHASDRKDLRNAK